MRFLFPPRTPNGAGRLPRRSGAPGELTVSVSASGWAPWRSWLYLALAVKRWLLLYLASVTLVALGLALVLTHLYRPRSPPRPTCSPCSSCPAWSAVCCSWALGAPCWCRRSSGCSARIAQGTAPRGTWRDPLALALPASAGAGPRPGARRWSPSAAWNGPSTLLRGLKELPVQLTAVLTVCDDGGSSPAARRDLRIPPPGDFRQCLAALADVEPW